METASLNQRIGGTMVELSTVDFAEEIVEQTGAKHPFSLTLFGKRQFSWELNDHKDSCTNLSFLSSGKTGISLSFYFPRQRFFRSSLL